MIYPIQPFAMTNCFRKYTGTYKKNCLVHLLKIAIEMCLLTNLLTTTDFPSYGYCLVAHIYLKKGIVPQLYVLYISNFSWGNHM